MVLANLAAASLLAAIAASAAELPRDVGYSGIWYYNQKVDGPYVYKYSGGFATYPQQQSPIAIYAPAVRKTFFCYGGTTPGKQSLLHMVSYYDHKTGTVPRPVILVDKQTGDAHDNPVLSIDSSGHIWVFSNAHGTERPAYIWKSDRPYDISGFTKVRETNFSYGHPWWTPGTGFFFLHTIYQNGGRTLFWSTSSDGVDWTAPSPLARIEGGDYQVTAHDGVRTATVFDQHPTGVGVNGRTNLYYLETSDAGKTWKTAAGVPVNPPLRDVANPALVHDYRSEKLLVFAKAVEFEASGRPVILYLTSRAWEPGPAGGPHQWKTARWTGSGWQIRDFTTSDHNYDHGALYIERDGAWRVIAPTAPGPQPYTTGGDMVMWTSRDQGLTWKLVKQLTRSAQYNHTYAKRPIDAHPDFYALWADGDTLRPSESSLYFTDRQGSAVWRLPSTMSGDTARPLRLVTK
jgi:hypothetical protein